MNLALTSNFLYTLLATGFIPLSFSIPIVSYQFGLSIGKTYSFAIFGVALAGANCKCVWLLALAKTRKVL